MSSNNSSGGIGFFGLLGITFIILKLCGVIAWPWIWVLSPIWGGLILAIVVVLVVIFFAGGLAWLFRKK